MRLRFTFTLPFACVAFWAATFSSASATTYYVATNGSDSNPGTIDQPFATVNNAVKYAKQPGDLIHVKAGNYTFSQVTNLPLGVSIEGEGSNTIFTPNSTQPNSVSGFIAGYSQNNTDGNHSVSNLAVNGNNHALVCAIQFSNRNNITIRNVSVNDCYYCALGLYGKNGPNDQWPSTQTASSPAKNILVSDCTLSNSGQPTDYGWSYGTINLNAISDSTIQNCSIDERTYGGVGIKGVNGWVNNLTIDHCMIRTRVSDAPYVGSIYQNFGIEIWYATHFQIADCDSNGGFSIPYNTAVQVHHNHVSIPSDVPGGLGIELGGQNCSITSNYFSGAHPGIAMWNVNGVVQNKVLIANNIFNACSNALVFQASNSTGINGIQIYNNTFYKNQSLWGLGSIGFKVSDNTTTISDIDIANNIISNTEGSNSKVGINFLGALQKIQIRENIFYANPDGDYRLNQSASQTTLTNNKNIDPQFSNLCPTVLPENQTFANFTLASTSPAKNNAVNVGLPLYKGTSDIGAFIQNAVTLNPTPTRVEAELNYSVVQDPGSYPIRILTNSDFVSNTCLSLFDTGDTVQVHFYVAQAGNYKLAVRLRAGDRNSPTDFVDGTYRSADSQNSYAISVDGGSPLTMAIDSATLSSLDSSNGGVYWGTVNSAPIYLSAGLHQVQVQDVCTWAILDYIQLSAAQ